MAALAALATSVLSTLASSSGCSAASATAAGKMLFPADKCLQHTLETPRTVGLSSAAEAISCFHYGVLAFVLCSGLLSTHLVLILCFTMIGLGVVVVVCWY